MTPPSSPAPAGPAKPASTSVYARAFHSSPAMQTITRLSDRRLVEANEAFLNTLGYSRDEVVGSVGLEQVIWVWPEKMDAFRAELAAKGFIRHFETEVRTKRSEVRTVLLSADLAEIDGEPHVLAAGVDITSRLQTLTELGRTHERLRQSEERFSKAFRSNPAMVAITRFHDGVFVSVNAAFQRAIGYTEAELVGRTARDINLHATPEQRERFLRTIAEDGFMRDLELVVRTKSGELRTLLASGERTEIDGVPHLLTVGLDITERTQAEAKLRESEQRVRESEARTRSLYENISTAVVVQDESGFLQANPAAWKLFGVEGPEQFLGHQPSDFSAPAQANGEDSRSAAQRHLARALAEGSDHFEWIGRRLDGSEIPLEVTLTSVQLEGRTVVQSVITDLTERKRTEAEHEQALQRERELSQLKTDFVALVSHEFRTPLEIIMSSVDNLDRYHERLQPEQRRQLLQTINKSVRRMAGMMEEVLLLGRLDSGGKEFKPSLLDLRTFCQRVCDEMQSATNRRCPIAVEIEGDLAAARGDESVLRHILTNLLSNAVKYSPEGEPARLTVSQRGAAAVFQVIDRGCGIPAADQKRLFQAFHRGSNVRQVPGTGLGLLIVRRCVELHGGQIEFVSREGQGTTFTVRVPLFGEKR